jgi:hypothetical protein
MRDACRFHIAPRNVIPTPAAMTIVYYDRNDVLKDHKNS